MTTPRVSKKTRIRLAELWRELHRAQISYATAKVNVDRPSFPFSVESEELQLALKVATEWRAGIRARLRKEYAVLLTDDGKKEVAAVEAYFASLDALYGQYERLSFTLLAGQAFDTAQAKRAKARKAVNRLIRGPKVLKRSYA